MSYEMLFWGLMIGWAIFFFMWYASQWGWGSWASPIFLWILIALLGLKVYGPMLHG